MSKNFVLNGIKMKPAKKRKRKVKKNHSREMDEIQEQICDDILLDQYNPMILGC